MGLTKATSSRYPLTCFLGKAEGQQRAAGHHLRPDGSGRALRHLIWLWLHGGSTELWQTVGRAGDAWLLLTHEPTPCLSDLAPNLGSTLVMWPPASAHAHSMAWGPWGRRLPATDTLKAGKRSSKRCSGQEKPAAVSCSETRRPQQGCDALHQLGSSAKRLEHRVTLSVYGPIVWHWNSTEIGSESSAVKGWCSPAGTLQAGLQLPGLEAEMGFCWPGVMPREELSWINVGKDL